MQPINCPTKAGTELGRIQVATILLTGCVSTGVQVYTSAEMNHEELFYVARYNDDIGVYESIKESFIDFGLNIESVYNAMSIPPIKNTRSDGELVLCGSRYHCYK